MVRKEAKKVVLKDAKGNYIVPVIDPADKGGSGLELCDIGMALYVDETKGLRRYLNGQIVDINTNTQAFLNRLKQITTLHPSLLCTENEWQTAKTMSAFGQVGRFVFNYSGSEIVSVRIPRVVNVQGLFDLQNLGMTVSESLPNITGTTNNFLWGSESLVPDGAFTRGENYTQAVEAGRKSSASLPKILFNASRSSSTYQDNAPVQQEAIQYPYFIQIATGSETENNIINEIELNNPYSLFDSKYSDHELNNLSWLKSEGQWNAKAVYPDAYDELLREYNSPDRLATFNKDAFTVVGSPTITDDGVASGFSDDDYINFAENFLFRPGNSTWEIITKIKTPITLSEREVVLGFCPQVNTNRFGLYILLYNNHFNITNTYDATSWAFHETHNGGQGTYNFLLNTDYYLKYSFTGDYYILSYSFDGINYTEDIRIKSSNYTYNNYGASIIGRYGELNRHFHGSIDLKQFSITVDGKKVFSGAKLKVKLSTETYTDYDFVVNPADETFRLPIKPNNLNNTRYLIEKGEQDGIYYRIYSDGWCEQGGVGTFGTTSNYTVNLLKNFKDTNYIGFALNRTTDYVADINTGFMTIVPLNTSSFRIASGVKAGALTQWEVKGYLAEGEYTPLTDNILLYYYVGETVQNANLIDAGRIGEQLAGKADKTEVEPLKTSYVIQKYQNGTSGYRIYSDGYCEQWGQSTTTNGNVSITFVKPFKTVVGGSSAILNSAAHFTSVMSLTTTGCSLEAGRWGSSGAIVGSGTTAPVAWVIYGYLADGQY